jgi:hypothetical protein
VGVHPFACVGTAMMQVTDTQIREALEIVIANQSKSMLIEEHEPRRRVAIIGNNPRIDFERVLRVAEEMGAEIEILENKSISKRLLERDRELWAGIQIQCDILEPKSGWYDVEPKPKKRTNRYKSPNWNF